ncbi:MAG: hypothetical protein H7239_07975 [Flavobacterium sp.]|nr:hypothetical protein [Flavobacterium sp.]
MKNSLTSTATKEIGKLLNWFLLLLILSNFSFSQESNSIEYRTINSYLDDFAKNELFVKKSLMEYSSSIIENQLETRAKSTSTMVIEKLKAINTNLQINDKGFEKNTLLRDSFIRMNKKTIECMTNGTLIMNDYISQSLNNVSTINQNLKERELNLISYFEELKRHEKIKKKFGIMNNIKFRTYSGNNIFEYNAFENILFYKINVIDEKINASINNIDANDFSESIVALKNIYQESNLKTDEYKSNFSDTSLNNATISYSNFIYNQKMKIIILFNAFSNENIILQKLKSQPNQENEVYITQYNSAVKSYNIKKNTLFDALEIIKKNKKIMYDNWFVVNRTFLKNNAKFDDIYQSYTYNN